MPAASFPFGKAERKILTVSYVQARRGCEDLSLYFSRPREKTRLIRGIGDGRIDKVECSAAAER